MPIAIIAVLAASAFMLPHLFAASPVQKPALTVPDCSGYSEPRVFLETQSWWSDARVAFPGQHIHLGTCFPLLQPVSGTLTLNVRGVLHDDPGNVTFLRALVFEAGNQVMQVTQNIPGGWACPGVNECVRDFQISIDTDLLEEGRREFRLTFNVPTTPIGNRQFNTTRWHACIRVCTDTNAPDINRMGAAGWYTGSEYSNVRINAADGQRLAYEPVSGTVPIQVWGEDDLLEVAIDARAHGTDPGLVIYDGPALGQWRTVLIDTSLLANGMHKLFIRGDAPDTAPEGINSGVFVLPFRVDNASALVAGFTATPTDGEAPLAVSFTDTSSNAPSSWEWTFGDGGSSIEQHPSHTYTAAGSYTVTLVATNALGSDTATSIITVTEPGSGGNASPVCAALSLTTAQDGPGDEVAPSCNDPDVGDNLIYAIDAQATQGVAMVTAGNQLHYMPNPGTSGSDSFTYTANDGTVSSAPATVDVTITPTGGGNTSPVCAPLSLTTAQDGLGEVAPSCTDADVGDTLIYTIASQGSKGLAWVTAAGNLRYVPTLGTSGSDSFSYTANDGTASSAPATVSVTITPTGGGGTPVTVTPTADTYVSSAAPTTTYGSATTLRSRGNGSTQLNSYLRFTVSGVGSASSATLRLYVHDASPDAGKLHRIADNAWSEAMPYAGQPALGALISDLGAVSTGAYRDIDVSAYVSGDGTYSFALIGESTDVAQFHSREGVNDPQLVVTPAAGGGGGGGGGTPQTVTPTADTYVSESTMTTSRATAITLRSRTGPQNNSYLRFTVSGVGSASSAVLRLYVSNASPDAGKLHRIADNAWSAAMPFTGQPALGALISDLGAVSTGAYRDIDVSAYVSGDGTYSFALIGESTDIAHFHSREGVNDPQLVVTP